MTQLQAGDMAPDFKSTTQDGETLTLADLKGPVSYTHLTLPTN